MIVLNISHTYFTGLTLEIHRLYFRDGEFVGKCEMQNEGFFRSFRENASGRRDHDENF